MNCGIIKISVRLDLRFLSATLLGATGGLSVSGAFHFHLCQPLQHRPSLQRGRCPIRGPQAYVGQVRPPASSPLQHIFTFLVYFDQSWAPFPFFKSHLTLYSSSVLVNQSYKMYEIFFFFLPLLKSNMSPWFGHNLLNVIRSGQVLFCFLESFAQIDRKCS